MDSADRIEEPCGECGSPFGSRKTKPTPPIEQSGLEERFRDPSAVASHTTLTDPEYCSDEDGNPLWRCEIDKARGEALEEAAKMAESISYKPNPRLGKAITKRAAQAIRSLKGSAK